MKKIFLLSLLSLLLSATLFGQVTFNAACPDDDLLVSVSSIQANMNFIAQGTDNDVDAAVLLLSTYHIIDIDFTRGDALYNSNSSTQNIDVSFTNYASGLTNFPLVIRYPTCIYKGGEMRFRVSPRYSKGKLIGFTFVRIPQGTVFNTMGVASGAAVAKTVPAPSGQTLGCTGCIKMTRKNSCIYYPDGSNCTFPRSTSSFHSYMTNTFGLGKETQASAITDVSVYPNPAHHTLFVKKTSSNNTDLEEIEILNLFGQRMTHKTSTRYGQAELQINTEQLDPGIYMLEISTSSDEKILRKITVQR